MPDDQIPLLEEEQDVVVAVQQEIVRNRVLKDSLVKACESRDYESAGKMVDEFLSGGSLPVSKRKSLVHLVFQWLKEL